jgi:hypothetical protein
MSWFDIIVVLAFLGLVFYEARQEAGLALLDTVATVLAVHLSSLYAPLATLQFHLKPLSGTDTSPMAEAICFGLMWVAGLGISRLLHRCTRWSMDALDPLFGFGFGLVIAVTSGHIFVSTGAQMALQSYGRVPDFLVNSIVADELRNFHTYHYVLDVFRAAQGHR